MAGIVFGLLDYPGVMQSVLWGCEEMLEAANQLCERHGLGSRFEVIRVRVDDAGRLTQGRRSPHVLFIPPSLKFDFEYALAGDTVTRFRQWYQTGTVVSSACAGAFLLAQTGLADKHRLTTHWALGERLQVLFPTVRVCDHQLYVEDGQIVSAGGVTAWSQLVLRLVARFSSPLLAADLGKLLLIDGESYSQNVYRQFVPNFGHGDQKILTAQRYIHKAYARQLRVEELHEVTNLHSRTLLRRFRLATGKTPKEYITLWRLQQACYRLELTRESVESIAYNVGYQDISAFRKVFKQVLGVTPGSYRRRFTALAG